MIDPFNSIKEALQIADIATSYGVVLKRNNQALCPFHNEKTPSFTIFPKTNSFKCFGCGAGGSVIDFVMQMYRTDALQAARKLDIDFNLGLFDHKPTKEEIHQQAEKKEQHQADKGLETAFEGFIDKAYNLLCDYFHLLQDWKGTHAPSSPNELDTVNPLFVEACHQLDYTEYLLDSLLSADIDEQISFYQTHRKELLSLANRIKSHTNGREADNPA